MRLHSETLQCEACKQHFPALSEWRGWNAFRRGLAANLYRFGVPDKTIQAILRHANVSTTQSVYIKPASDDTHAGHNKNWSPP